MPSQTSHSVPDTASSNILAKTDIPNNTSSQSDGTKTTANDETQSNPADAPLIEHLRELRRRIIWSIATVTVATVTVFAFAGDVFEILVLPYDNALGSSANLKMIYTAPQEFFITQIKLSLFLALYITFPVLTYHAQAFIAPGLYSTEKRVFFPYMIAAPLLFILGGAFVYYVIMPLAMQFFLSMQQSDSQLEVTMLAKVSEYLSLVIRLMIAFGLIFQMPIILSLLAWVGIVTSTGLRQKRRYAIVGIFLVAAFLTPPDPISQIGLAIPALLLYEISILVASRIERSRQTRS